VKLITDGEPFAQLPFKVLGLQEPIGVLTAMPVTMTWVVSGAVTVQGRLVPDIRLHIPRGPPEKEKLVIVAKEPVASMVPLNVAMQDSDEVPFVNVTCPVIVKDVLGGEITAASAPLA